MKGGISIWLQRHGLFLSLLFLLHAIPLALAGSIAASQHDNLDSEVVYTTVIGRFWAMGADPAAFEVFLGGVLGWADFARTLQPISLLYALFPPIWAYVLTNVALLVLAYAGMRLLLAELGLPVRGWLACLAAFGLSYTSHGAGLAGAPLLMAVMLRDAPLRWPAIVLALLLGLNSSLVLHAVFLPFALLALLEMTRRAVTRRMIALCFAFVAGSLATSVGLIATILGGTPTHRADWVVILPENPLTDWAGGTLAALTTMGGAYHAVIVPALHVPVILMSALAAGGAARRAALILVAFTAVAIGIEVAEPWLSLYLPGPFASVQWHRILLFAPLLALIVAGQVLAQRRGQFMRWIGGASLGLAVLAGAGINTDALKSAVPPQIVDQIRASLRAGQRTVALQQAATAIAGLGPADLARGLETWDRHFRPGDWACVKTALARVPEAGRVLSHGVDPMLAPFYGIPAVDGYHNLYPLAYKRAFRPVIAAKLAVDPAAAAYFDGWGSRISTLADRGADVPPDPAAARRLGATHLVADRMIGNPGFAPLTRCGQLHLYHLTP